MGLAPLTAAKAVVALVGGVTTVLFYAALRQLIVSISAAAIFTGVFLSSATYIYWYSVIETYAFAGLSICTMLAVIFRRKPTPLYIWTLASAFTLAITVTNWTLGLTATFFKLPFRRFVFVSACALLLVIGFALAQKLIFPSSQYFFTTSAITDEYKWTQIALEKKGSGVWDPLDNLKSFFVYGAVAPHHQMTTDPKDGVTNRGLPLATLKPLVPAIALWVLLFAAGIWGIIRNRNLWTTGAALAAFIAGQAALHSFYGEITFLYVADFFPVLLAIAACAYFTPARKLWLAAAVALLVINATGNVRRFNSAVQSVNATLSPRSDEPAEVSSVAAGVKFAVKPERMRECDPPAVATLTWDVATPDVQTVKIFAVNKQGGVTLFTHSGSSGTAETGPWVSAGSAFLLKDGDEIKQLGKLIIQPTKC